MNIFVTGGTGFIGRHLLSALDSKTDWRISATLRRGSNAVLPPNVQSCPIDDLRSTSDYSSALESRGIVVHLAARAHIMRDRSSDPIAAFRRVNVEGTLAVARQAARAGVRRFVFLSSIKVNGEQTMADRPFVASDVPAPCDAYSVSKMEAEQGLRQIQHETGMEVLVIRVPLVYGPGVKANFLKMMEWIRSGVPLPFGAITKNRRSLLAVDNLVDLIMRCIAHPSALSEVLLVSDGEDLSTADLLRRIGIAVGRPARLVSVPPRILETFARLTGRGDQLSRLLGSLQVDMADTRKLLSWSPPVSVDSALANTVVDYLATARERVFRHS